MNLKSVSVLLFSFVCLHLASFVRSDEGDLGEPCACLQKLSVEDQATRKTIIETCKKKLSLDKIPSADEVEKNGFDDKCFAKCKLMEMKIINDQGVVDKTIIDEFFKKVDPAKKEDVMKLTTECAESTMKAMAGDGGINDKTACKAAAMMKSCFMKGVTKLC